MPKKAKRWEPPQDPAARTKALQPPKGGLIVAPWMERCLLECCTPLQRHDGGDWLARGQPGAENGDRDGQTLARFCRPGPHRNFPSKSCCTIYLTQIGPDDEGAPAVPTPENPSATQILLKVPLYYICSPVRYRRSSSACRATSDCL